MASSFVNHLTDLTPHGPEGLFSQSVIDELSAVLDDVRRTALAA